MEIQKDIEVRSTYGYGKGGAIIRYVRPIYYCINRSRKVSGATGKEVSEKLEKVIKRWYFPKVIKYSINGETVYSNSKENALIEYWRICEKSQIGIEFDVLVAE